MIDFSDQERGDNRELIPLTFRFALCHMKQVTGFVDSINLRCWFGTFSPRSSNTIDSLEVIFYSIFVYLCVFVCLYAAVVSSCVGMCVYVCVCFFTCVYV